MPIFDDGCNINSKTRAVLFLVVAVLAFAALIGAGLGICTLFNINQIIGVLLGLAVGIGALWYVYDMWGNAFLSKKERYKIE